MKKIILSSLVIASLINANELELMLQKSLTTTDACLSELESNQLKLSKAKLFDDEKVVAMIDANNFLEEENKKLIAENDMLLATQDKLNARISLLSDQVASAKDNTPKTRAFLHDISDALKEENEGLTRSELMNKNIYTVPVHMLNVRFGHSSRYSISSIVNKDELVEFSDIYVRKHPFKKIVWLKTKMGWMYVPSQKDSIHFITSLKKNEKVRTASLSQDTGGEKG